MTGPPAYPLHNPGVFARDVLLVATFENTNHLSFHQLLGSVNTLTIKSGTHFVSNFSRPFGLGAPLKGLNRQPWHG